MTEAPCPRDSTPPVHSTWPRVPSSFVLVAVAIATLLSNPSCATRPPAVGPATTKPAVLQPTTVATTTSRPATRPSAFAGPAGGFPRDAKTGAISKVAVTGFKADRAWFHLAVPQAYTPEKAWPLMIVLHGGPGGNGPDDIISFFRGGLMAQGVISVYPNAIEQQLLEWNYPHSSAYLLAIIRQVASTYRVDPTRIYLVGVSMGGGGAWANGAVLRDVWAGIGPIAGWYGPTPAPPAEWLKGIPIYCLHGQNDAAVPAARSRMAVAAMKKAGHRVLELAKLDDLQPGGRETMVYREVPGSGHNVFIPWRTQGGPELGLMIAWLLQQKRTNPADLDAADAALAEWGRKAFKWAPDGAMGRDIP